MSLILRALCKIIHICMIYVTYKEFCLLTLNKLPSEKYLVLR
jgi:hypothetical protein